MKLRQTLVMAGCLLFALAGCGRKPLTPAAPWTDVVNDSLFFLATSTDPNGLQLEYAFDWGDDPTFTTRRYRSGETAYARHSFGDPGWREIRVQARNENGKSSAWSPPLRFRKSHSPLIVDDTISGLVRWAINRWYHASVKVSDPDGDSVSVKFVWDGDEGKAWTAFAASGSVITDSCIWSATGPHAVKVVIKDKGNMVARPESTKIVNVSAMAVTWSNYGDVNYDATPTLGMIGGEPVLYCGLDDVLDCYSLDGRLRWSVPTNGSGFAPSLSPDNSRLYLTEEEEGVSCLDARTGELIWNLPLGSTEQSRCTPALGPGGAIYVTTFGSYDHWLRRVTDHGGSATFDWGICLTDDWEGTEHGIVVARGGAAYTVSQSGPSNSILFAVDSSGEVLWKDSTHVQHGGPPIIDRHDRVVVADEAGGVHCFNPDGTLAYSVPTAGVFPGTTAIGPRDEVIVTDYHGWIRAYDSTGGVLWTSTLGVNGWNTPCVAEDSIVILYDDGDGVVYSLDCTGQTLWEYSIEDSLILKRQRTEHFSEGYGEPSPVIGPNGDLYIVCYGGVFCLSGANLRLANTAWPTYNHDNARSGWAGRQQR
jgi:PQQ-like domain